MSETVRRLCSGRSWSVVLLFILLQGCASAPPPQPQDVHPAVNGITWLTGRGKSWRTALRLSTDGTHEIIQYRNFGIRPSSRTKGTWCVLSPDLQLIVLNGKQGVRLRSLGAAVPGMQPPTYLGASASYVFLKRREELKTTKGFRHVGRGWYADEAYLTYRGAGEKDISHLLRPPK